MKCCCHSPPTGKEPPSKAASHWFVATKKEGVWMERWNYEMGDVNMEERQRSGQLNDQSQSLINPYMSTLTVSQIFNKRPVQSNSNQLSTRFWWLRYLYRTIPQHSLTNSIHYIVNIPALTCMSTTKAFVWQEVQCESDNFSKNTMEKIYRPPFRSP